MRLPKKIPKKRPKKILKPKSFTNVLVNSYCLYYQAVYKIAPNITVRDRGFVKKMIKEFGVKNLRKIFELVFDSIKWKMISQRINSPRPRLFSIYTHRAWFKELVTVDQQTLQDTYDDDYQE